MPSARADMTLSHVPKWINKETVINQLIRRGHKHVFLPYGVSLLFSCLHLYFKLSEISLLPLPLIPCSPISSILFCLVSGNQTPVLMMQTHSVTRLCFSAI